VVIYPELMDAFDAEYQKAKALMDDSSAQQQQQQQ
jgi:hypothetical protein